MVHSKCLLLSTCHEHGTKEAIIKICHQYLSHTWRFRLIPAVRMTHVIHEPVPCIWPSSPRVLRTSVVRASDRCTEDRTCVGSISVGESDFFCLVLVTCWLHHFSWTSKTFARLRQKKKLIVQFQKNIHPPYFYFRPPTPLKFPFRGGACHTHPQPLEFP